MSEVSTTPADGEMGIFSNRLAGALIGAAVAALLLVAVVSAARPAEVWRLLSSTDGGLLLIAGEYDTSFIEREILPSQQTALPPDEEEKQVAVMLAAIAGYRRDRERAQRAAQTQQSGTGTVSNWKLAGRRSQLRGAG